MTHTRRYFIAALALPLLMVLIAVLYAVIFMDTTAIHISLILTPYICFFLLMAYWSLHNAPGRIRKTAYRAPLIFLAFQSAYLVVEYLGGVSLANDLTGLAGLLSVVATYVVIVGYLYLFIMEQGYFSYIDHKRHPSAGDANLRC
ncbi:MAG TPA: hypothetical protein VIM41_00380 [Gammaproteobacteria bacterium]